MIKFGVSDSVVVPLALPGGLFCLLSAGVVYLACPSMFGGAAKAIENWASSGSAGTASHGTAVAALLAVGAVLVYFASVLFGTMLAVLASYFEAVVLDWFSAKMMGLGRKDFSDQWHRYVDHLETEESKNSLISDFVDLFLFQLRSSVALFLVLLLALWFAASMDWPRPLVMASGFVALSLLLMLASAAYFHKGLAEFRQRRFGESPIALRDALEVITKQVERWCDRRSYKPLAILLPVWVLERKKDTLPQLSAAVEKVAELGDPMAVYESERDALRRAKRLLDEQTVNA